MTTIYKICEQAEWRAAEPAGSFSGTAADRRDGFIHFSTAAQLAETVARHYAKQTDLILIAVDGDALGAHLKWEPSRGGDLFPHLYGALNLGAVTRVIDFPSEPDGSFLMPPALRDPA